MTLFSFCFPSPGDHSYCVMPNVFVMLFPQENNCCESTSASFISNMVNGDNYSFCIIQLQSPFEGVITKKKNLLLNRN